MHAVRLTPAGADFDVAVIVNRTSSGEWALPPAVGDAATAVVSRVNEGMNIGAWDHGWRCFPGYAGYLFLQDECELKAPGWLRPFVEAASGPSAGLIGESWNDGWDRPWAALKESVAGHRMRDHEIDGKAINRVELYLSFMGRHDIAPGERGGHLRALTWFASRSTLEAMGGFLHGATYGECIGAEIAATKKVEELGLRALQVADEPFAYFGHAEWNRTARGQWRHRRQEPPSRWMRLLALRGAEPTQSQGLFRSPRKMTAAVKLAEGISMDRLPVASDSEGRIPTKYVDHLSDEDLDRLNDLLPWQCFTLDSQGRRFGKQASATKRNTPQQIPDRRIRELNRRFPLNGLSVLEVGCFEGIHTIALADHGANVIGIDSRIENVVKTMVRTWSFGFNATIFKCDVEQDAEFALVPEVDITHHIGVLYHLVDPVSHLKKLLARTRNAIVLDTHYAREQEAVSTYQVDGVAYRYKHFREGGRKEAFAGMYDHVKWLPLETLVTLLKENGFSNVDVAEVRDERNGARVLIYANRIQ